MRGRTVPGMATIRKQIRVRTSVDEVWAAARDVGALHERLVPGFVVDTRLEPGARLVTFASGAVARELIVTLDDAERRLVWAVVGSPGLSHHNGSLQVFPDGDGTLIVWIADVLPDGAAGYVATMMDQGMAATSNAPSRGSTAAYAH
jgi:hypothetical protein